MAWLKSQPPLDSPTKAICHGGFGAFMAFRRPSLQPGRQGDGTQDRRNLHDPSSSSPYVPARFCGTIHSGDEVMNIHATSKLAATRELRAKMQGRVVSWGDDDYVRTRPVWNGAVENQPALFAV
jgi:hypothetical protein